MVNVLEPRVKHDLLAWFIKLQLAEYGVLFADNQDVSRTLLFTTGLSRSYIHGFCHREGKK